MLGRLVGAAALDNEAAEAGVSVGDERIAEEVRQTPSFQGIDGEFDPETYRFALQQNNLTGARIRNDPARRDLPADPAGRHRRPASRRPAPYVDTLMGFLAEERDVTWAALDEGHLAEPIPDPTLSELEAFHSENAAVFTLPETKVLTVAALTPRHAHRHDRDRRGVACARIYDERRDEYETPEHRLVERLVFFRR